MAIDAVILKDNILERLKEPYSMMTTSAVDQEVHLFDPEQVATMFGIADINSVRNVIWEEYNSRYSGLEAIIKALSDELEYEFENYWKLDDLSDVIITDVKLGDFLFYDGNSWVNEPYSATSFTNIVTNISNISYENNLSATLNQLNPNQLIYLSDNYTLSSVSDLSTWIIAGNSISIESENGTVTINANIISNLADLQDVSIPNVTNGDFLYYDGSLWINEPFLTSVQDIVNDMIGGSTYTSGSILFAGSDGLITEDNANFFWDDVNNNMGIGTSNPKMALHIAKCYNRLVYGGLDGSPDDFQIRNNVYYDYDDTRRESMVSGYSTQIDLRNSDGTIKFYTTTTSATSSNAAVTIVERMSIGNTGASITGRLLVTSAIGLGITSPTAQLHTSGTVRFEGAGTPVNGRVLTTDSDGNATWQNFGTISTSGYTSGSALFANIDGNIDQDNTNFFWDNVNKRLGIGNHTPESTLHVTGRVEAQNFYTEKLDGEIKGQVALIGGTSAMSGYVQWLDTAEVRKGYMGWDSSASNNLSITLEHSCQLNVVGGNVDINGNNLILDANGDTYINNGTEDNIKFYTSGVHRLSITNSGLIMSASYIDLDSNRLILDLNADSYLTASADDNIDFYTSGAKRLNISNNGLVVSGTTTVSSISARGTAATVYLTHSSGLIQSRTAAQVRSDIAAASSTHGVTTSYLARATSTTAFGNSLIQDNGTALGIRCAPNNTYALSVSGSTRLQGFDLYLDANNDTYISTSAIDDNIRFYTSGVHRLSITNSGLIMSASYIDLDGNRLILDVDGNSYLTTSADNVVDVYIGGANHVKIYNEGLRYQSGPTSNFECYGFSTDSNAYPALNFVKSHHDTIGTFQETLSAEALGSIAAYGVETDGGTDPAAVISFFQEGSSTTTRVPGQMRFYTSTTDAANNERMRILSNGNIGIGVTAPTAQLHTDGTLRFEGAGTPADGRVLTSDINGNATWEDFSFISTSGYTSGSVVFIGSDGNLAQDNNNFFWDNVNNRLGIGTKVPDMSLHVSASNWHFDNYKTHSFGSMAAVLLQAKRFEIARFGVDRGNWADYGPVTIELFNRYFFDGYKRYTLQATYGTGNDIKVILREAHGISSNYFRLNYEWVVVSGNVGYVSVFVEVDYYSRVYAKISHQRTISTTSPPAYPSVWINDNYTSAANISAFYNLASSYETAEVAADTLFKRNVYIPGTLYLDNVGGDTYLYSNSDIIYFYTSGVNRLSIGTNSLLMNMPLDMNANTLIMDDDADSYIRAPIDDSIDFYTAGSLKFSVTNSGLVLNFPIDLDGNRIILDTDGDTYLTASADDVVKLMFPNGSYYDFTINGLDYKTTATSHEILLTDYSTDITASIRLGFYKSHNNTLGTLTPTISGEVLGQIYACGVNSISGFATAAVISFNQDGSSSSTRAPANIVFKTASTSSVLERMRFPSSGTMLMSTDIDLDGNKLILDADGDTYLTVSSDDNIQFYNGNVYSLKLDSNGYLNLITYLDGNKGDNLIFDKRRNITSAAQANDVIGSIIFRSNDNSSTPVMTDYARIESKIIHPRLNGETLSCNNSELNFYINTYPEQSDPTNPILLLTLGHNYSTPLFTSGGYARMQIYSSYTDSNHPTVWLKSLSSHATYDNAGFTFVVNKTEGPFEIVYDTDGTSNTFVDLLNLNSSDFRLSVSNEIDFYVNNANIVTITEDTLKIYEGGVQIYNAACGINTGSPDGFTISLSSTDNPLDIILEQHEQEADIILKYMLGEVKIQSPGYDSVLRLTNDITGHTSSDGLVIKVETNGNSTINLLEEHTSFNIGCRGREIISMYSDNSITFDPLASINFFTNNIARVQLNNAGMFISVPLYVDGYQLILDADRDTYLTASADDNIDFYTSGAKRLNISNSGLVVSGTTTVSSISARGTAATVYLTHSNGLIQSRTASQVLSDLGVPSSIHGVTTSYLARAISTSAFGNSLIQDNGTALGIRCTPNNTYALSVSGDTRLQGFKLYLDADNDTYIDNGTDDNIYFVVSSTDRMWLNTTSLTMNVDIDLDSKRLILDSDADTYLVASADDNMDFYTNGIKRLNISSDGSIIGNNIYNYNVKANNDISISGFNSNSILSNLSVIVRSQSGTVCMRTGLANDGATGGLIIAKVTLGNNVSADLETVLNKTFYLGGFLKIVSQTRSVYGEVVINNNTVWKVFDYSNNIETVSSSGYFCIIPEGLGKTALLNRMGFEVTFHLCYFGDFSYYS